MFGSIGMPELIIIFVIALIIFGPRKLPELGRSLGKSIGEFKRASNDLRNTLEEEIKVEDTRPPEVAETPSGEPAPVSEPAATSTADPAPPVSATSTGDPASPAAGSDAPPSESPSSESPSSESPSNSGA